MSDLEEGEIVDSDSNENVATKGIVSEEHVESKAASVADMTVDSTNVVGNNHLSANSVTPNETERRQEVSEFSFHESNISKMRDNISNLSNSSQFSTRRSPQKAYQKLSNKPLYKHYSDEDSSATSDEDTDLWKCKKARYFSSSKDKSMEISEEITSPPRNGSHVSSVAATKGRKLNNIWGSVLQEQSVTHVFSNIDVEKIPETAKSERNVEAYNFTNKFNDDNDQDEEVVEEGRKTPETEVVLESHDPFDKVIEAQSSDITLLERDNVNPGLKRKRKPVKDRIECRKPVKDRIEDLSEWSYDQSISRDHYGVTFDDSDAKIVNAVSRILDEPKIALLAKAIEVLGSKKVLETAYLTEDVEEAGGMMTNDGYRRRTPGGVFIQLLKKNKDVTKEQYQEIFGEEERQFKKALRQEKKRRKKEAKEARQMYQILPQAKYTQFGRNSHHPLEEKMDDDLNENRNTHHHKKKKKKKRNKNKNDTEMDDENNSSGGEEDIKNSMDNETGEVTVTEKSNDYFDGDLDLDADADIVIG